MNCTEHMSYAEEICPDCGLEVDKYGNTEAQFDNCCFPDCGCDGARLCMAGEASEHANKGNVEGMWSRGSDPKCRKAAFYTIGLVQKEKGDDGK